MRAYFDLIPYPRHPEPSRLSGNLIGSRNGIHYTQHMSGPTDTIDIDFLWHGQSVPDDVLAITERAGKAWSYRLIDVLGPHGLTDGVVTRLGLDENGWSIPYYNDGILVDAELDSYSFGGFRVRQTDGDDFMTRSGYLVLSGDISCCGDVRAGQVAAQQVGHALGHKASEPRLRPEAILRYVDYERGLWTGPAVTEANGGVQVSFEKTSNGVFDFDHLGACSMIMSGCGEDRMTPHEMDFAYLKDIGYTIADEYPTDPETYSYRAWAEHSSWSVTAGRALVFDPHRIDDFIGVTAEATGNPSEATFVDTHSGTVTWNGSLLATDLTSFKPVFGDAEITLSADAMDGTAVFTELETVRKSDRGLAELTGWRVGRLDYPVSVTSNGFQDADGRVMGAFFGASHEEAAGTLHDEVAKITGAFGGKRPVRLGRSAVYDNPTGTDPRDTWRPVRAIQSYHDLRLFPLHPDPSRLTGTVLGSRNGFTYTQQMSGPTDTIDIDFTGYFPNMPDFVQGLLERAGKSWSYRLKDVLGAHQLTDGVVTRLGRDERGYSIPYENDGILVDSDTDYQNPAWDFEWAYSRASFRNTQIDGQHFMARSGWVELSAASIECCGDVWAGYLASHEIGHAIGHAASSSNPPEHIARHVDLERGLWTGPAVTEANDGVQVPFQRLDDRGDPSPDGELDFGHLGACPMIMSYCGEAIMIPHDLDFAYLKDIGYTILDEYPTDPEMYGYAAWADHSVWSVAVRRALFFDPSSIDDFMDVQAEATGNPSAAAFADSNSGTVTWKGSLLATDLTSFSPVFGGAEITLSADTMDGAVALTGLETVRESDRGVAELTGWRVGELDYPVSVTSNGFQDADGRVTGALYGPSHEEAAGTIHDELEKIMGAFGGKQSEPGVDPAAPAGLKGFDVYDNLAGIDTRDTWKPTGPIESYFDLRLSPSHPGSSLASSTVLGSGDGITYTQQMSGPTDTIDIDFIWHRQDVPDRVLGIVERAGKAWSYRLKDVFGQHELTDTVVTRLGRDERGYAIRYDNDGVLVGAKLQSPSSAGFRTHQFDREDFMTRSGSLRFSANDISCCGDVWREYIAARQVGHVLGHKASEPRLRPENILRYVDYERGLWTGPAVTEANGGTQVSFQSNRDGTFDFDHLGACPMIMSDCGDYRRFPNEMDFAYLKDIGYTVADGYPTDPEMYSYGAWADHSSWSVTVGRSLVFDPLAIDDFMGVKAEATGDPSAATFAGTHSGTVTWSGSLLATDQTSFAPVFGDAEITLSADTMDGTVAFTELESVRKSDRGLAELTGWRVGRLDYPVTVTSDGFEDLGGRVMGAFYGPSHEEVAGTLHDDAERITGAFGGKRR